MNDAQTDSFRESLSPNPHPQFKPLPDTSFAKIHEQLIERLANELCKLIDWHRSTDAQTRDPQHGKLKNLHSEIKLVEQLIADLKSTAANYERIVSV